MPRTDEGEFELVLGNRQLLSVFFIVVVLLGVFFVMGYILGKNASPSPIVDVAAARKPSDAAAFSEPLVVDRTAEKPSPTPAAPPASEPVEQPAKEPVAEPVKEPVKEPVREAAKPTPPPPPPVQAAKPAPTGPAKSGLYLQVAAVGRAEADVVSKVLRAKGFAVDVAPVGDDKTFRVLVGPLERDNLGKTRGELTSLGFSPFPRTI
jgi:cell division protein FtsN